MRRQSLLEAVVFVSLFVTGVLLRWQLREIPNFAPVAALSLFAGFYFRSWWTAAALPLSIMVVSDLWIGGYAFQMMLLVYAMLALPVACRGRLRRCAGWMQNGSTGKWLLAVFSGSLAASCAFFLVTNWGAWMWFDMYDHTWTGLIECYGAALPFFRHTLAGDMFFAAALFGGYTGAYSAGWASRPELRTEHAP